jgi:uncharacterized protein
MKHLLASTILLLALAAPTAHAQEDVDADTDGKAGRPTVANPEASGGTEPQGVDPARFGKRLDEAFGAFQRGHYLTALEQALPRAESGDPAAQTLIAEIYARGLGVRRDGKEAAKWYARAAEQGTAEAQLQYALMLLDGEFVERDADKALTLMRSAAEAGKPLAQFNLGQMLADNGGPEDEVVMWYERAAAAGLADAQYAMAQIYANGYGGKEPNQEEARLWLELAARQNFDTAQLDLGTWLVEGRGGEPDHEEGFAWLKRAAEAGNVAAQARLGKLYLAGIGTEGDRTLAAAWYLVARRAGLVDHQMEIFLEGYTDEEIQEARERADTLR